MTTDCSNQHMFIFVHSVQLKTNCTSALVKGASFGHPTREFKKSVPLRNLCVLIFLRCFGLSLPIGHPASLCITDIARLVVVRGDLH